MNIVYEVNIFLCYTNNGDGMNFDGILFHKVGRLIEDSLLDATLNRIDQTASSDFCLTFFKDGQSFCFSLSLNPSLAHFTIHQQRPQQTLAPTSFLEMLRYHLLGARITLIHRVEQDRIMRISFRKESAIGSEIERFLYIEMTGRRTNLILTKGDNFILDALHKFAYDEGSKRIIARGLLYQLPQQRMQTSLSTLIEKEMEARNIAPENMLKILEDSTSLYVYDSCYHLLPLTHRLDSFQESPILKGIYSFYQSILKKQAVTELLRPILKILKTETTRLEKRLTLLDESMESAKNAHIFKYWGDLIFTYSTELKIKRKTISVKDEEKQEEITIPLDDKVDIKTNALRFYQRYKKLLASRLHIEEQKGIALERLSYFETLASQLDNDLNLADLQQIKSELDDLKYTRQQKLPKPKKKTKQKITLSAFLSPEGPTIYVGKNNIQNDYLTFSFAKNDDLFFHVKDMPGAHVLVRGQPIGETTIRLAAKIAAYYSKARHSSSIPVDYTAIANIKKISGGQLGKVSLKKHKTIYIDMDDDIQQYALEKN